MKHPVLVLFALLIFIGCSKQQNEEIDHPEPLRIPVTLEQTLFSQTEVVEGALYLDLRANRLMKDGEQLRVVRAGERIALQPGVKALLVEHHSLTEIVYLPKQGLLIDAGFDARSFGGGVEVKHYLLKIEE
jgi:hypothetical protein